MSVLDLIKASRPKVVGVEISTGRVYIKEMDGHQFEVVQRMMRKDPQTGESSTISDAHLASLVLCEADGAICFPTPEAGSQYLLPMLAADLRKISKAALHSAGLIDTKDERTDKEKNS